jgi:hypothetical protein
MIDFRPTETPLHVPVSAIFEVRGRVYVVDVDGALFNLLTEDDNPEMWCWEEVYQL